VGIPYESPLNGALLQGEILQNVWEHRTLEATCELAADQVPRFYSFHHPLVVVMDAACDLESDHRERNNWNEPLNEDGIIGQEEKPSLVPYVTLCDVYDESSIKNRMAGSDVLRRTRNNNQEARYHHLPAGEGPVAQEVALTASLFMDFKRVISIPTRTVYEGIRSGDTRRIAVIPSPYVFDLVQRFYAFRSRIGVP